jgi:hypothetical protein
LSAQSLVTTVISLLSHGAGRLDGAKLMGRTQVWLLVIALSGLTVPMAGLVRRAVGGTYGAVLSRDEDGTASGP